MRKVVQTLGFGVIAALAVCGPAAAADDARTNGHWKLHRDIWNAE